MWSGIILLFSVIILSLVFKIYIFKFQLFRENILEGIVTLDSVTTEDVLEKMVSVEDEIDRLVDDILMEEAKERSTQKEREDYQAKLLAFEKALAAKQTEYDGLIIKYQAYIDEANRTRLKQLYSLEVGMTAADNRKAIMDSVRAERDAEAAEKRSESNAPRIESESDRVNGSDKKTYYGIGFRHLNGSHTITVIGNRIETDGLYSSSHPNNDCAIYFEHNRDIDTVINRVVVLARGGENLDKNGAHGILNRARVNKFYNYGALLGGGGMGGGTNLKGKGGTGGGGGGGKYGRQGGDGGTIIEHGNSGKSTNDRDGPGGGGPGGGAAGNGIAHFNRAGNGGRYDTSTGDYKGQDAPGATDDCSAGGGGYGGGRGGTSNSGKHGGGGGGGGDAGGPDPGDGSGPGRGGYSIMVSDGGGFNKLYNLQGGNNRYGPLFYAGPLPQHYYICITDQSNYGQLFCTGWYWPNSPDGTNCVIDIDPNSVFNASGTTVFKCVLKGIVNINERYRAVKLKNKKKYTWRLISKGNNIYDLEMKDHNNTISVGGSGGSPSSLICNNNSFVTEFSGRAGSYIDKIGIKCSNGTLLGSVGGNGGREFNVQNPSGFDKLVTKSGSYIDSIGFYKGSTEFKKVGGVGGGGPTNLECNGGKIMGLNLRAGSFIDNLQVVCSDITEQPNIKCVHSYEDLPPNYAHPYKCPESQPICIGHISNKQYGQCFHHTY